MEKRYYFRALVSLYGSPEEIGPRAHISPKRLNALMDDPNKMSAREMDKLVDTLGVSPSILFEAINAQTEATRHEAQ